MMEPEDMTIKTNKREFKEPTTGVQQSPLEGQHDLTRD